MNNSIHLELLTFNAGKIAIPLKIQEDSTLNPQPNFLIIENIFNYSKQNVYNLQGELEETEVMNSYMKLVYREILPEENGKGQEMREVLLDNVGNIYIPEDYVGVFKNHERMIKHEELLNTFLPMFKFRGCLKGFKLQYDAEKSKRYLELLEELRNPTPQPTTEKEVTIDTVVQALRDVGETLNRNRN